MLLTKALELNPSLFGSIELGAIAQTGRLGRTVAREEAQRRWEAIQWRPHDADGEDFSKMGIFAKVRAVRCFEGFQVAMVGHGDDGTIVSQRQERIAHRLEAFGASVVDMDDPLVAGGEKVVNFFVWMGDKPASEDDKNKLAALAPHHVQKLKQLNKEEEKEEEYVEESQDEDEDNDEDSPQPQMEKVALIWEHKLEQFIFSPWISRFEEIAIGKLSLGAERMAWQNERNQYQLQCTAVPVKQQRGGTFREAKMRNRANPRCRRRLLAKFVPKVKAQVQKSDLQPPEAWCWEPEFSDDQVFDMMQQRLEGRGMVLFHQLSDTDKKELEAVIRSAEGLQKYHDMNLRQFAIATMQWNSNVLRVTKITHTNRRTGDIVTTWVLTGEKDVGKHFWRNGRHPQATASSTNDPSSSNKLPIPFWDISSDTNMTCGHHALPPSDQRTESDWLVLSLDNLMKAKEYVGSKPLALKEDEACAQNVCTGSDHVDQRQLFWSSSWVYEDPIEAIFRWTSLLERSRIRAGRRRLRNRRL